jgi:hypothetical protein
LIWIIGWSRGGGGGFCALCFFFCPQNPLFGFGMTLNFSTFSAAILFYQYFLSTGSDVDK